MLCYVNNNKSKYPLDGPEIERGKCDTDEWTRNFSIEQLSIISNSYVVVSKGGGGGWWYCLWEKLREKYGLMVKITDGL